MGTSSYLIAVGSNAPGARAIVAAMIAGATASAIRTTRALGPGGRAYANAVMRIECTLAPPALLARLKEIERAHGRRPARRWGPAFWAGGELSAAPALGALARPADNLVPAVPAVPMGLAEVMSAVMPTGGASCPGALPSCAAR